MICSGRIVCVMLGRIRLWNGWKLRWALCIIIFCVACIMSRSLSLFSIIILRLRLTIIIVLIIIQHQFVTLNHFHSLLIRLDFLILFGVVFHEPIWSNILIRIQHFACGLYHEGNSWKLQSLLLVNTSNSIMSSCSQMIIFLLTKSKICDRYGQIKSIVLGCWRKAFPCKKCCWKCMGWCLRLCL